MRVTRFFPLLFVVCVSLPFMACGQGFTIEGTVDKSARPIRIQCEDASARALAQMAFGTHGAFRVVDHERAAFTFRLEPQPGDRCALSVLSGQPAQVLFQETITGSNPENAVLRACDLAVRKTTGQPGYFAGTVACVSDRSGHREIYLGDLFFRRMRQVTKDESNALRPYLSPEARTLFYRGYYRTGFPDVFKVDLASGRRVPFASYRGTNAGGAVSPDGRYVALTLSSPGNAELYVQDISGQGEAKRLTRTSSVEADPAWSPDGRRLIVTSDRLGGPQLFEIPARGGPMTRLPTNISGYCAEANWNPRDEKQVVFTAAMRGGYQLALFEFGTPAAKPLTSVSGDAKEPVWLADGRHVLYTEETPGGDRSLNILDTVSGKRTRVSPAKFGDASQAAYAYPR